MPRTSLTPKAALGSYGDYSVADSADLTMTAADVPNKNQFTASGNDIVFIQNSGASPYTVTFTSAPDEYGRSKDITTYSLAAGEFMVVGPLKLRGWVQTDGKIYLEASNAAVKFGVVSL